MLIEIAKEHTGGAVVQGYGLPSKSDFWVSEGEVKHPRVHVVFQAQNHQQVDQVYKAALASRGKGNGAPGPRPHYHKDYYGAFILDPDGHNIEVVCHLAQ